MIDVTEEFGLNAGRIWRTLNESGPLTEIQLIQDTGLRENEFYAAVGWLARENKIKRDNRKYQLDETNLAFEIGEDAGKILTTLNTKDEINTNQISRMVNLDERNIFSALGWLARENKIQLEKKQIN